MLCVRHSRGVRLRDERARGVRHPDTHYGTPQGDATTGDNFVAGAGWWVDPGADSYVDDPVRERPLSTNTFFEDAGTGKWVHPGKYYAYLDIKEAAWGYNSDYLYFKMKLFGKGSINDVSSDPDFGTFASGTHYNIIFNQRLDGEANGGILLQITGDETTLWTGPAGTFESKATHAYWDKGPGGGDVGDTAITTTKEDGDSAGDGFEATRISSDGKLGGSGPVALYGRITPGPDHVSTMPTVEIALNYKLWNDNAATYDLPDIDPEAITLLIFETDRGIKDNANYLWNDGSTIGQEGSPYKINDEVGDPITQLKEVYELDRLRWRTVGETPVVPLPSGAGLTVLGLASLAVARWRKRRAAG